MSQSIAQRQEIVAEQTKTVLAEWGFDLSEPVADPVTHEDVVDALLFVRAVAAASDVVSSRIAVNGSALIWDLMASKPDAATGEESDR